MPKQRQTCTRCSQRRQKCDRKAPCTRCVQNNEGHLCTTKWVNGYNPNVHRKYPRRSSPTVSLGASSSGTSSDPSLHANGLLVSTRQDLSSLSSARTTDGSTDKVQQKDISTWPTKLPDITIEALLNEKDQETQQGLFDRSFTYVKSKGTAGDGENGPTSIASCYSNAAKAVEIQHLQSVLPSREKVLCIVGYYEQYMMYWSGGIYHGPTFRKKLLAAYGQSHILELQSLEWKWVALLFSILSSGIVGSSEGASISWGFSISDKVELARLWGAASVSCLNLGNYTSQYSICSVQAIYIMHAYEHLVGSTNQWVALRSVAIVIAKGLGLHKLGPHPDDDRIAELNPDQKEAFIEREIGRRTWYILACQDWACSNSQSAYIISIQKRHFTSAKPRYLDEETMMPVTEATTATVTHVGNYLFKYGELLLEFHNTMEERLDEDELTHYAAIIKFDGKMRALCVEEVPECISPRTPHHPSWPKWVAWATRLHQASANHKLIMIHQNFLSKSFKDMRYTYSRWACASAAKNIINLYNTREPEEPQWWVEQAFITTAGICLVLDLFHRSESDPETQEYQACVQKAIKFLQQFFASSVAVHGARLLMSLLQEHGKLKGGSCSKTAGPMVTASATTAGSCAFASGNVTETSIPDAAAPLPHELPQIPELPVSFDDETMFNFDIDALGFEDLMYYLPPGGSLNNNVLLDSMLSANGWPA
ncbi:hypothetical protein BDW02DRAFT_330389 [Decorospora gaudefroyi]|uniref:Zn(2)-C6 fungal-type domain-containing protein n=1 Tax=Decorospora gaudefroyi TaxID=184978 RepID=A0A6A5K9D7_9PLEO|nr:hypothetical protein BDW02DRAFT_330389 [Decorospora gaudefroyi]